MPPGLAVMDAPYLSADLARKLVGGGSETILMSSREFRGQLLSQYLVARWTTLWEFTLVNFLPEDSTDFIESLPTSDLLASIAQLSIDRIIIERARETFLAEVNASFRKVRLDLKLPHDVPAHLFHYHRFILRGLVIIGRGDQIQRGKKSLPLEFLPFLPTQTVLISNRPKSKGANDRWRLS